ncbi:MAG: hypothetical protein JWM27_1550 [Gemmatimonadetes bacterium]|nr:hypothetical protein [Gemmatimonadota bacterium]
MAQVIFATPLDAFRLQENDLNMDYDGGRVVLVGEQDGALEAATEVQGATLVLSYRRDEPMRRWPLSREDRARRRFTVLVLEDTTEQELHAVRAALGAPELHEEAAPPADAPPPAELEPAVLP